MTEYEKVRYSSNKILLPEGYYSIEDLRGFASLWEAHQTKMNKALEKSMEESPDAIRRDKAAKTSD